MVLISRYKLITLIITIVILASFSSCKKDNPVVIGDVSCAYYQSIAERTFIDVITMVDEAGFMDTVSYGCASISIDTASNPDTLFIDFGSSDCLCTDGLLRKGMIKVAFDGFYSDSLTPHVITFDGYALQDNKVFGSLISTNLYFGTNNKFTFDLEINGQIITSSNDTINILAEYTREWAEGLSTSYFSDNVYRISGESSFTGPGELIWNSSIIETLRFEDSCMLHYPVSGVVEITPNGGYVKTVDYGSGSCDQQAIQNEDGIKTLIELE
jgi:hypothetical protein